MHRNWRPCVGKDTDRDLRQRSEYFSRLTTDQLKGVDNDLMKEQHPSMPINIDRQKRVTFGGGRKN
jgi:hypothetical protein